MNTNKKEDYELQALHYKNVSRLLRHTVDAADRISKYYEELSVNPELARVKLIKAEIAKKSIKDIMFSIFKI